MSYVVLIEPRALEDIQQDTAYYEMEQKGLGAKFQSAIDKDFTTLFGNEFVIDTKTGISKDSVYFKDNGNHVSISIEDSGGEGTSCIIYKEQAKKLLAWLQSHV